MTGGAPFQATSHKPLGRPGDSRFPWTAEIIAELVAMTNGGGLDYAAAAAALSAKYGAPLTKNAAAGKIHRFRKGRTP